MRATIALRLTLWYAAAFTISALLALLLVYSTVAGVLGARTDAELRLDLQETVALVEREGRDGFRTEVERERAGPDSVTALLRLWSADGVPVEGIGFDEPDESTRRFVRNQTPGAAATLRTVSVGGFEHGARVATVRTGSGMVLEFGQSLEDVADLLGALRLGILLVVPTVLLLGGPIGWFMARRALRGVENVTRTALEIADGAMDRRVPVGRHGDELDRLALAFNRMLDQIGELITGMREVTDNVAHDLKTPLARIRASAERAAARGATPEELAAFAGATTEECDRMQQILDSTLEIAEAQAGATRLRLEDVDLSRLVEEARDLFGALAEDASVELRAEVPEQCRIRGDRGRLQRIVANLLDNALKYTPAGGAVTLALTEEPGAIRLDVRDTGVGIPEVELRRIFERFYRGDGSRSGHGSGLGLSLARAFARAHGGDLTAVSTPGVGSVFTLRLKRAAA